MLIQAHRSHTFICATARWFGLESRVTLNNKTGTDTWITAELYSADGKFLGRSGVLGMLPNDGMFLADIPQIERSVLGSNTAQELLAIFSMIPASVSNPTKVIEIDVKEIYRHFGAQDHYIEHYHPETGYSTGVLYQTVPMNSSLFSSTFSFLMQAPKIFLSDQRNTAFLLMYYSPDDDPKVPSTALLECRLKNEAGDSIVEWTESVPRGGLVYIDVKKVLSAHGVSYRELVSEHGFAHFEAFCDHASFISLTCNYNQTLGTFDIEHSLPPVYYQVGNKTEDRKKVITHYKEHFFTGKPLSASLVTAVSQQLNQGAPNMKPTVIQNLKGNKPELAAMLQARSDAFYALSQLVMTQECRVEQFDYSYLDVLPQMLKEMHGFDDQGFGGGDYERNLLVGLKRTLGLSPQCTLAELTPALRRMGMKDEQFRGRFTPAHIKSQQKYDRVDNWSELEGVTKSESVDKVNRLQVLYSLQSGGSQKYNFTELARPETGDVWSSRIQEWARSGVIQANKPSMTIGPRWASEITYFRDTLGLKGTIGLDLFSNDPELVHVGDMHDMKYEDNKFELIYQRNTFNKAYDIRKALDECCRVLRPGGILISDDCLGYTDGVSEIARTNVTRLNWFLQYLGDRVDDVLFFLETPTKEPWFSICGQIAVTIKK